jgi:hypothetical protein
MKGDVLAAIKKNGSVLSGCFEVDICPFLRNFDKRPSQKIFDENEQRALDEYLQRNLFMNSEFGNLRTSWLPRICPRVLTLEIGPSCVHRFLLAHVDKTGQPASDDQGCPDAVS